MQEQIRSLNELKEMAASYGGCWILLDVWPLCSSKSAYMNLQKFQRVSAACGKLTIHWYTPLPPCICCVPPRPPLAGDDISRPATNAREAVQW